MCCLLIGVYVSMFFVHVCMQYTYSACVVFHKQVRTGDRAQSSVEVSQKYFDPVNRFFTKDNERYDKYIKNEFLANKIYGCRVVLTNVSSVHQRVCTHNYRERDG